MLLAARLDSYCFHMLPSRLSWNRPRQTETGDPWTSSNATASVLWVFHSHSWFMCTGKPQSGDNGPSLARACASTRIPKEGHYLCSLKTTLIYVLFGCKYKDCWILNKVRGCKCKDCWILNKVRGSTVTQFLSATKIARRQDSKLARS